MKRNLLVIFAICLLFVGCNPNQKSETEPPNLEENGVGLSAVSQKNISVPKVNINDYDALYEKYFNPFFGATMFANSWTSAYEINPDCFPKFYGMNKENRKKCGSRKDTDGIMIADAEDMEKYVQQYFDVSVEYLRTSEDYDAENQCYYFGLGGGLSADITDARQEDDLLFIDFETYSGWHRQVFTTGTITIQLLGNDQYKYLSCNAVDMPEQIWVVGTSDGMPQQFVQLDDYENLNRVFLEPALADSGIASVSWSSPEEIDPEFLYKFYLFKSGNSGKMATHSEKLVETEIQRYFEVPKEQIHKTVQYDSSNHIYKDLKVERNITSKVTHVELDPYGSGDIILDFELYQGDSGTAFCKGSLKINRMGDVIYFYESCKVEILQNE